ncbi:putative quinol monooxygenase [Bradyrhizobium sp. CCBAU 53338]|uniref:putative quinol monooxygenase n=1 Tax=Bradyrhizobium sp. CCBAU 53338 TaxID=1325111 RepID=UPI00188CB14C|nr:antibiotic biosynthesis monooxygenase [Bradyrhizobium sp. CCBAU 53338]QOZ56204.1 antibiotic biosynthesis monooxygenase [Bradyrhizobium sp. CCBAU 53338]
MNARRFLVLGASILTLAVAGSAGAQEMAQEKLQDMHQPYVRVAEIEIDPLQVEPYTAAVKQQIEAAVRLEPGVLALYAVADQQNPAHVFVFEIYADVDAYKAHIETAHFKTYKAITQDMVKSLKLRDTVPILLGAKRT